eukprot:4697834-Alexandrium_andersonii.AAC.1
MGVPAMMGDIRRFETATGGGYDVHLPLRLDVQFRSRQANAEVHEYATLRRPDGATKASGVGR